MTVIGTVHDRRFTAMTFSFSYLYLLSKSFPFCVHPYCGVHTMRIRTTLCCYSYFKNLIRNLIKKGDKQDKSAFWADKMTDACSVRDSEQLNQNERDRRGKMCLHCFHQNMWQSNYVAKTRHHLQNYKWSPFMVTTGTFQRAPWSGEADLFKALTQ